MKLGEYISGGFRTSSKGKKLIIFYKWENRKVIEDDYLLFPVDKTTNKPVGFIVKITTEDEKFSGFENTGEHIVDSRTAEMRLEHISTIKAFERKNQERKAKNTTEMLEKMTLYELKKWANKSYQNKRTLRYYLLELF